MSYLGRSAKLSLKAQEKVSFLATAGQTSKTGLSYTPSFIEVYVNGVSLTDTTDFTATNGNSVTFTVALLLNDEVTVISLKTFTVADHYTKSDADTLRLGTQAFNRLSTDGTIVDLQKDGTTVGSIGSVAGVVSNIILDPRTSSNGGVGIQGSGTDTIIPVDGSGATANGTKNLGNASARWKDLYLSGGVYLGGTGAANKLDDYEEGTWTPVVSGASIAASQILGTYTKIGNRVLFQCYIYGNITSNGTTPAKITGLPFTTGANGLNQTVFYVSHNTAVDGESIGGFMSNNNTQLIFLNRHPNNVAASWINGNGKEVMVGGTYFTDS